MLKALEVVGFKSFADKTRFDFPDGITVVVGPNGSGKSNVVDAMKWVLGAQSAKALRGKDMADVIFKGSAAGGRKPANSAEATLVFDNSKNQLPVDAPEVQVTRRVYRSGESEFLINQQPCRLKDIKDLFRGTGVGVDAYSLIEQGKVDRMLQASAKDRRMIFEEAAGVSRYKAKKIEAERRLQRVEQNLLRLGDLVREMSDRLDRLKSQAGKAQRFREMNERWLLLRTQLGLAEWRIATTQRNDLQQQVDQASQQRDALETALQEAEQRVQTSDMQLHAIGREAASVDEQLRAAQQTIVSLTSDQRSGFQRREDTLAEISKLQNRLKTLRQRADDIQGQFDQLRTEVHLAKRNLNSAENASREASAHESEAELAYQAQQQRVTEARQAYLAELHLASEQSNLASGHQSQLAELHRLVVQRQKQLDQAILSSTQAESELEDVRKVAAQISLDADHAQQHFETTQGHLEELRRVLARRQEDAAALQGRLEGARERLLVLEELENQQEGVGIGAKQLLQLSQQSSDAPWNSIRGMVADLVHVDIHLAPLVDVALGNNSQAIVLADGSLLQLLRDGELELEGRVTLLRLERLPSRRQGDRIQLDGLRGVIGRADRLVSYAPEHESLMRYLLGTTWLVDSLATALDLSHFRDAGLRFVTASGQLIESDGTVTLGAMHAAVGLVARRSEMLAARNEIRHYAFQLKEAHKEIERFQDNIDEVTKQLRKSEQKHRELQKTKSQSQLRLESTEFRLEQLQQARLQFEQESQEAVSQLELVRTALDATLQQQAHHQAQVRDLEKQLSALQVATEGWETKRKQLQQTATEKRIELAKCEQRLDSLETALQQLSRDQNERREAVDEALSQLISTERKLETIDLALLNLTSSIAMVSVKKEAWSLEQSRLAQQAAQCRQLRQAEQKERDSSERALNRMREKLGKLEGEFEKVEIARQVLWQRFHDDHQLDLNSRELSENTPELKDKSEAEREASELKQEIASVGAVNMEALQELDQEQGKFDTLFRQYDDLRTAKESLEKIIARINQDSRRLFVETLDAIRTNFQTLYRKSFGGGHADLILEESSDEMEAGVEIIATPPGKTTLSNSLLSGGEKALTAVALLLAIFQFRPSPFCVLDEVDAPFDEANIGRFVKVLEAFLDTTKFIVVTHSKKTMTAATTLYGVTMQESGVSKKVAVRFEEVGEDGQILTESSSRTAQRRAA